MNWIKFKLKDEIDGNTDCIWSGELPSNGEEVLVSDGQFVRTDIWSGGKNAGLENWDNYHQQFLWWAHLPQAPTDSNHVGWNKIKTRPLTKEEQDKGLTCSFIYDCNIPNIGEEILNSNGKWVSTDYWEEFDGDSLGFSFANDENINTLWWRAMPKPPKTETYTQSVIKMEEEK